MNSPSQPAIETHGLVKTFGEVRAVDCVDLAVERGSVHGFLGPNGAGKTTILRILATLLRPDAGNARVLGYDVLSQAHEVRRRVALTGQFASVDEDLTGAENLTLLARLLGFGGAAARARAEELLSAFDLAEEGSRLVKTYSGGQRRRLDIAASIIVTPELLFLDEPTTGLDPRSRGQVWQIIRSLAAGGTTILLTTQYLDEADQLAGRISLFDSGRIIAEGRPAELKSSIGAGRLEVRLADAALKPAASRLLTDTLRVPVREEADPATLSAAVTDAALVTQALSQLPRSNIAIAEFSLGRASLDEVFLALTGRATNDNAESTTEER